MRRPDIPEAVKREVRRRCGFGCAVCGLPVFEYDHITPYSIVQCHEADNLVLLCPTHHLDKSAGRMTEESARQAKDNPHNLKTDFSSSHLIHMTGDRAFIKVSTCEYTSPPLGEGQLFPAILVGGVVVFGATRQGNCLLLDVRLTDAQGNAILIIEKGEIRVSTRVFDYNIYGRNISIRTNDDDRIGAVFSIEPTGIHVKSGRFVYRGMLSDPYGRGSFSAIIEVIVDDAGILILPSRTRCSDIRAVCRVGIDIH